MRGRGGGGGERRWGREQEGGERKGGKVERKDRKELKLT